MTKTLEECHLDSKFFDAYEQQCRESRKEARQTMDNCDQETYKKNNSTVCATVKYYTQVEQHQCNDKSHYETHKAGCDNTREETMRKEQQCEYSNTKSCTENRMYAVQTQQERCTDVKYYQQQQKECENVNRQVRQQTEKCSAEEYYRQYKTACEHHTLYVQKQQHKCATDVSFQTQHQQTCDNQTYYTAQEQKKCEEDSQYYAKNQKTCTDNEHYYVKDQQQKCVDDVQYYEQNQKKCQENIEKARTLQQTCDSPTYYAKHQEVCDVQRYSVQLSATATTEVQRQDLLRTAGVRGSKECHIDSAAAVLRGVVLPAASEDVQRQPAPFCADGPAAVPR